MPSDSTEKSRTDNEKMTLAKRAVEEEDGAALVEIITSSDKKEIFDIAILIAQLAATEEAGATTSAIINGDLRCKVPEENRERLAAALVKSRRADDAIEAIKAFIFS